MSDHKDLNEDLNVLSEDIAHSEIVKLFSMFERKKKRHLLKGADLADKNKLIFEAIREGRFDVDTLVYKLDEPVLNDKGDVSFDEIKFRSRLKMADRAALSKGLTVQTDSVEFSLRLVSYLANISKAEIDKLSKYDNQSVHEIATVFL